jgi:hypothetical protein
MRRVALMLAMVVPLALGACGDSTGPGDVAGIYTLSSINGDPVPVVVAFGPPLEEVTQGIVRLNANGTFSASHTLRVTSGGSFTEFTEPISGTYTRSGNNLILTFPDPDGSSIAEVTAVWQGDRLTVDDNGDIWVYVR